MFNNWQLFACCSVHPAPSAPQPRFSAGIGGERPTQGEPVFSQSRCPDSRSQVGQADRGGETRTRRPPYIPGQPRRPRLKQLSDRGRAGRQVSVGAAALRVPGATQWAGDIRALPTTSCTCPAALLAGGTRARGEARRGRCSRRPPPPPAPAAALTCRTRRGRRPRSAALAEPQGARAQLGRREGRRRTDAAPLRRGGRTAMGAEGGRADCACAERRAGSSRPSLPPAPGERAGLEAGPGRSGEGPAHCGAPWRQEGLGAGCLSRGVQGPWELLRLETLELPCRVLSSPGMVEALDCVWRTSRTELEFQVRGYLKLEWGVEGELVKPRSFLL